jgi:hypothetical protein
LARLALNRDPPALYLLRSYDSRREPPAPSNMCNLKLIPKAIKDSGCSKFPGDERKTTQQTARRFV